MRPCRPSRPAAPRAPQRLGVTQTEIGEIDFPGAGLPMSIRSAVTSSPVSSVKEAQGFGMRPKVILWIGSPVVEFMMVVATGMSPAIDAAIAVSTRQHAKAVDSAGRRVEYSGWYFLALKIEQLPAVRHVQVLDDIEQLQRGALGREQPARLHIPLEWSR